MRTALCAPRDARASRGLIGMWTSHIGRTLAELEASTSCRREFTDKENVRRRTLFLMVRPAHAPHDGSIAPLGASPRTVWSVGERALTSSQHGGVAFPSIASMGSVGREPLLTYVPAFFLAAGTLCEHSARAGALAQSVL